MRAGSAAAFGTDDLAGRTVGVIGAGKVGGRLIGHLLTDGATVVAHDPDPDARAEVESAHPGQVAWVPDLSSLLAARPQILSPNALGGLVTTALVPQLAASGVGLVCGGANNQLASPEAGICSPRRASPTPRTSA